MATLYAKHVPVYLYNFTNPVQVLKNIDPEWEAFKGKDGEIRRTPSHADDLPYVLEGTGDMAIFWEQIGKDSEDIKLSQNMISTWTSFAKTGKPDGPWGEWPTLGDADEGEAKILHIQDPPKLMPLHKSWRENDAFWNSLSISEYGKKWSNNDDDDKEKCIH